MLSSRILNARPDTLDFRDRMYETTLVEVPQRIPVERFRAARVPVLDQGTEGACTGFALATVAHYLLRTRRVVPDTIRVSPRMLYDMARRYDEWPGEQYDGSSARGAMKGWHKHGVCAESLWKSKGTRHGLTHPRTEDATKRPLGAYLRVNHKDLLALHAAITEVGVLYATANVHDGWDRPDRRTGRVKPDTGYAGHAFAVVAYDERGFWIQNSWGGRLGSPRTGAHHI